MIWYPFIMSNVNEMVQIIGLEQTILHRQLTPDGSLQGWCHPTYCFSCHEIARVMDWRDFFPIVVSIISVASAVLIWGFNEFSKRRAERHQRKEEQYRALLYSMRGFMESANRSKSLQDREEFLHKLDLCWLYCPPKVVRAGYDFLDNVKVGARSVPEQQRKSLGNLIMSIREDLKGPKRWWNFQSNELCESEFQFIRALSIDSLGHVGFTHIPFRIRNALKNQIGHLMAPVHMTQKDFERWQALVRDSQWSYQDPPLDEWRRSALQDAQHLIRTNAPVENTEMTTVNRDQILSLTPEDLLLNEEKFLACEWTAIEPKPPLFIPHDQIQSL